jgi:hypothetical protein
MPKAKTPRVTKAKAEKKVLQMPEAAGNGNGSHASLEDLQNEIRIRAYEIYEQRGYTNGQADEDWLRAEREVLARHGNQQQTA